MRIMWITKNVVKCVHVSKESIYIRFNLGGVGCLKSFQKNDFKQPTPPKLNRI